MRFIKIVGLALFASLAVGMVASASASATLGIFECTAGSGVSNLGSNCLTSTGGEFTVKAITGATFTSKSVGGNTILTAGTKKIECAAATNEGVITSLTEDRATIKFTGCKEEPSGVNCETSGSGSGNLTVPVSSKIVSYTEGTNLKAGLLLAPRNSTGVNELSFSCTGTAVKVYGSVIGAVEPEDTASASATVKFAVNASKEQEIQESSNSLRAKFAAGNTEKATQAGGALLDFTLQVEVMG